MDGGITAENFPANGLARAAQTAKCSVASDGARTRYPGGAYECTWNERAAIEEVGNVILKHLKELLPVNTEDLKKMRTEKFLEMGRHLPEN